MKNIGERIKKEREKRGWTQAKLAEILNIEIGTLSGYERNYRQPNIQMLNKIATAFNLSTDYLLGREIDVLDLLEDSEVHLKAGNRILTPEQRIAILQALNGADRMAKVTRKFIMPNGEIKDEKDLTSEQKRQFAQKIVDAFTPICYKAVLRAVLRDLEREREQKAAAN